MLVFLVAQSLGQESNRKILPNQGERLAFLTSTRLLGEDISFKPEQPIDSTEQDINKYDILKNKPIGMRLGRGTISFVLGPFISDGQGLFLSGVFGGINIKYPSFGGANIKISLSASYSNLELFLTEGNNEIRSDFDSYRLRAKTVQEFPKGFNFVLDLKRTTTVDGLDSESGF